MTSSVIYPNSNNCASSSMFSTLQYSCAFSQLEHTSSSLLTFSCCCTFPFIGHTASSPSFLLYFNVWILPFVVPSFSTSKTLYFFYHLLPSDFYFSSHSILHHSTHYYFKFILGNWFPFCLFPFIPAVADQIPELSTIPTHPLFPFF